MDEELIEETCEETQESDWNCYTDYNEFAEGWW